MKKRSRLATMMALLLVVSFMNLGAEALKGPKGGPPDDDVIDWYSVGTYYSKY